MQGFENEIQALRKAQGRIHAEREVLRERAEALQRGNDRLESENRRLQEHLSHRDMQQQHDASKLAEAQQYASQLEMRVAERTAANDAMETQVMAARQRICLLEGQLSMKRADWEAVQALSSELQTQLADEAARRGAALQKMHE
jgi:chromosome segregation ATPase